MLVTKKLWIYKPNHNKRVIYRQGSFYREFIITHTGDTEFQKLLNSSEKPIYGILMHNKYMCDQILDIGLYMNVSGVSEEDIILIPTSLGRNMEVEVVMDGKHRNSQRHLRDGVIVRAAMLFDTNNPKGFGSAEFLSDPLRLLKDKTSSVIPEKITDSLDLARTLWKIRNEVKVLNYRSFSKELRKRKDLDEIKIEVSGTSNTKTIPF